jgi:molecular chaperone GrpE
MSDSEDPTPQSEDDFDFEEDITFEEEDEQPKDTIKRLRDRLKECASQKQEYLDGWQRAKADMVNNRKEFSKERERISGRVTEEVISSILPVLDSFEMAFADSEVWNNVDDQWRSGVEHIHSQLATALKLHGVEAISPEEGNEFDPKLHTSVDTTEADNPDADDSIARCEKTGYRIDDRIIRSANVVVYKSN